VRGVVRVVSAFCPAAESRFLLASARWAGRISRPAMLSITLALIVLGQQPAAGTPSSTAYQCTSPAHDEFDFWIGQWDVAQNGTSKPAGVNIITKEHGGCVVVEHWTSPSAPLSGSSFNIYDRTRAEWVQTWVDSNGGLHSYRGRLQDGKMVFWGDVPLPTGARFAGRHTVRLTFSKLGPDKIRQLSESLMPDGSWTVNYDLIYTRREK
jgi:hypothetical protein